MSLSLACRPSRSSCSLWRVPLVVFGCCDLKANRSCCRFDRTRTRLPLSSPPPKQKKPKSVRVKTQKRTAVSFFCVCEPQTHASPSPSLLPLFLAESWMCGVGQCAKNRSSGDDQVRWWWLLSACACPPSMKEGQQEGSVCELRGCSAGARLLLLHHEPNQTSYRK